MADNNQSGYTYYAFISYKREDEKWAKWLQKKLESYGFPVALRKNHPDLPTKIRPIFRDKSELSGGNLKDEIEKGLRESKYLIVICSPRAAQSPWVSKEVQYFIDNGREKYIIPFIIGGSPNAKNPEEECFPEGLRKLSSEKEILGININEMGRDAAAIKVIARMFDLRFDTLWQRHERAKRRMLIGWVIIAVIVIAAITGVAIFINSQNLALEFKNKELDSKNLELEESNQRLAEENLTLFNRKINSNLYQYVGGLRVENDGCPETVAFSPKEPLIAYADERGYWLHNIKTNIEQELKLNDDDIYLHLEGCRMEFSKDGAQLLVTYHNGLLI